MKYLSLFSGVGGFERGITAAMPHTECIGYSEIDKYAINTYESHYEHTNLGNVTTINETTLPDFDLVVGGFPCQAFSVAGKRRGFNETRGTLFFDIARILKHKRPRHLLLENVKGLLSHDQEKTFQTILGVLTDLGYDVEWQVLNAKDFGVPQNRERIFIVGHLRGYCGRKVFPLTYHPEATDGLPGQCSNTLTTRYYGGQANGTYTIERELNAQNDTPDGRDSRQEPTQPDTDIITGRAQTATRIRRLTPTECERLMSWPDGWVLGSDSQKYKQCGNGVVSNVVEAVISAMEGCLNPPTKSKLLGGSDE